MLTPAEYEVKKKHYLELYDIYKRTEKQMEGLKAELLEFMKQSQLKSSKYADGRAMAVATQDRTKFVDDILVTILDEKGLEDCVETKRIPNGLAVKNAIAQGRLKLDELQPAITGNIIEYIKINPKK